VKCPNCRFDRVRTYDVRQREDDFDYVVRVKKCPDCGHRFRTIEIDIDLFNRSFDQEITDDS
jgi:transcriptional regulator NrdR family protein